MAEFLIYIAIVAFTVAQSASTKLFSRINDDAVSFNKIKSASAFLLFAILSIWGFEMHRGTMIYGCLFGILMCISMHSGYMALASGPMSLTSMIVAFSVVIPVVYGIAFRSEELGIFKITGLLLFVIALIFTNINKPKNQKAEKGNLKWAFFVTATFLANGFNSVLQKYHQEKFSSDYCKEFMFWAMLVCFVVFLFVNMKKISAKKLVHTEGKIYGVTAGITNALVGYLTIKSAGFENASVLFPIISAGTILGVIIVGKLLFKEKLKYNHIVAFVSGITAVIFLKMQ